MPCTPPKIEYAPVVVVPIAGDPDDKKGLLVPVNLKGTPLVCAPLVDIVYTPFCRTHDSKNVLPAKEVGTVAGYCEKGNETMFDPPLLLVYFTL